MAQPSHKASSAALLADNTSPYSISVTLPATAADNDIIIIGCHSDSSSSTFAVSGGGATYTSIGKVTGTNIVAQWFWARLASGNTAPTATSTGASFFVYATMYTGCITSGTPYRKATLSSETSAAAVTTSAITPDIADSLVVSLACIEDDTNITGVPPTGWTDRFNDGDNTGDDGRGLVQTYNTNVTAGTTVGSVTMGTITSAEYWVTLTLALVPVYVTGPLVVSPAGKVYLKG